jgi:hypothetical protein
MALFLSEDCFDENVVTNCSLKAKVEGQLKFENKIFFFQKGSIELQI